MDLRSYNLWYGVTGGFVYPRLVMAKMSHIYKPVLQPIREGISTIGYKKHVSAEPMFYGLAIPLRSHVRFTKNLREGLITSRNSHLNTTFDGNTLFPSTKLSIDLTKEVKITNELSIYSLDRGGPDTFLEMMNRYLIRW